MLIESVWQRYMTKDKERERERESKRGRESE